VPSVSRIGIGEWDCGARLLLLTGLLPATDAWRRGGGPNCVLTSMEEAIDGGTPFDDLEGLSVDVRRGVLGFFVSI
jgi:hypothetical protein